MLRPMRVNAQQHVARIGADVLPEIVWTDQPRHGPPSCISKPIKLYSNGM